ncbi:MAG: YIEGIA family protein [Bacillota bacterium]|nr:YIEGIA family protein [Bacillota bacterium]MDD3297568.1 YIEGIA family protein [Bacillota bacterium]MDD3850183.1 YIEGIA family protein [Bacillota bacterium]MDD4707273.1 YIEGIA family protein [Bacillota bacterium]
MADYGRVLVSGLVLGSAGRLLLLRADYRQYPSFPRGYVTHLVLGIIAAALGAIAVPALAEKEYTAVTFLALAAQQFRDIRSMERDSLESVDSTELVPRGSDYIEDIAKTFEARNYIAMVTALSASLVVYLSDSIAAGVLAGAAVFAGIVYSLKGEKVGDMAEVVEAKIEFDGPLLMVDGVALMNIGHAKAREKYLTRAIAVRIIPKDDNARVTLGNVGQRQALVHNAATQLGIRKDVDEPEFTPIARRNTESGDIVMAIFSMEPDIECLIEAVKKTPVLESSKRKPLDSPAGRKASD